MEEDVDKKEEQEIVEKQPCSSPNSDEQLTCSLYLSCSGVPRDQDNQDQGRSIERERGGEEEGERVKKNVRTFNIPHGFIVFVIIEDGENLRSRLEEAIVASEPSGPWQISETSCGFIVTYDRETDVDNLLQRCDFTRLFEGPVQVRHDRVNIDRKYFLDT